MRKFNSNLFIYVGLRHLKVRPARTILTTLGISLGVALFIAIQIINTSTLNSFTESLGAVAGKSVLTVYTGGTGFAEAKVDLIAQVPGVKAAVPMIESHAYFAGSNGKETLYVMGVDLLKDTSVRTYKTTDQEVIDDPLVFLNQPDSVIVTDVFAKAHNFKLDSKFDIATSRGKRTVTVRGMLSPEGPAVAYGGLLAIMDIDAARLTFGKEGKVDRVDILPKDGFKTDEIEENLKKALGPGFKVERPDAQSKSMEHMISSYQILLKFFSMLALLVGVFLVFNSVSISVAERKKEIGTLRALGALRSSILTLFISESIFMGALGSVLGVFLGRELSKLMLGVVSQSISTQYLTPIKPSRLVFSWEDFAYGALLGLGSSVVAAFWPSLKATMIQPLEAMKQKEIELSARTSLFQWSYSIGLILFSFMVLSATVGWVAINRFADSATYMAGMIGSALLGPSVVVILILIAKKIWVPFSGAISRLSHDNLLRNPKRTSSNVTALMVGLMLVIMISALNLSFKKSIMTWINRVLHSDFLISSQGRLVSYQVQALHEDVGREIEKIPGIVIGPERGAYGLRFIHFAYEGKQLGLKAYDRPDDTHKKIIFDVQDRPTIDAVTELFSGDVTCFVSENFVLHFKKKTGDIITVDTPTGAHQVKIVGKIIDYASNEGVLYFNRDVYKKLWNDPLVDVFGVYAQEGVDKTQLRQRLDNQFGASRNLMITSNSELKNEIIRSIDDSFAYTKAIETAALAVAMLGLLNTFLISIMERTRELGMLRAVGMSRGQLARMILGEALLQGGCGAIVAVGLGTVVASLWVEHSLSHILGWIVHFTFPWQSVGTTILTGLAVTLIAGIYPAYRASRMDIREALEYD